MAMKPIRLSFFFLRMDLPYATQSFIRRIACYHYA